jgi:two-component system, LytTR family, response regulator LytT
LRGGTGDVSGLAVLAVDDERPALDEIGYLLRRCAGVSEVLTVESSTEALRHLRQHHFDVVMLDVRMPGLDGLELASVLAQFSSPPAVVFVTAHEEHALEAFDVNATGYLLKPVSEERLADVLKRIVWIREASEGRDDLDALAVEAPGRTTMVARSEVEWVESAGDYVRLHTATGGSHLVRVPLAVLEVHWSSHGFARIHRSYLVSLRSVRELRADGSQTVVRIGAQDLPVSRRHLRELRDRLVRHVARGPR